MEGGYDDTKNGGFVYHVNRGGPPPAAEWGKVAAARLFLVLCSLFLVEAAARLSLIPH